MYKIARVDPLRDIGSQHKLFADEPICPRSTASFCIVDSERHQVRQVRTNLLPADTWLDTDHGEA